MSKWIVKCKDCYEQLGTHDSEYRAKEVAVDHFRNTFTPTNSGHRCIILKI